MTEQFKWVDYYEEFASKLLEYRNNRKELIDKIVKVYDIADYIMLNLASYKQAKNTRILVLTRKPFQKCQNDTSGNVELTGQEI